MDLSDVLNLDLKALQTKTRERSDSLIERISALRNSGKTLISAGVNQGQALSTAEPTYWTSVVKQLDKIQKDVSSMLNRQFMSRKSFDSTGEQLRQIARAVDDKLQGIDHNLRGATTTTTTQPVSPTPTTTPRDEQVVQNLLLRAQKLDPITDLKDALRSIKGLLQSAATAEEVSKVEKWLKKLEDEYLDKLPDPNSTFGKALKKRDDLLNEFQQLKNPIAQAKKDYPSRFSAIVAHESVFLQATRSIGARDVQASDKAHDQAVDELEELKKLVARPKIPPKVDFEGCQALIDEINKQIGFVRGIPMKLSQLWNVEKDLGEVVSVAGKEVQAAVAPLASFTKIIADTIPFYAGGSLDNESKIERNIAAAKKALATSRSTLTGRDLFKKWNEVPATIHADKTLVTTIESKLSDIEVILNK